MKINILSFFAIITSLALSASLPAAITAGDVVGIDFGGGASPDPSNWNVLAAINTDIAAGSLINTSGSALAGVAFTTSGASGENADSTAGSSYASIPANAQGDWWFENSPGVFTFEFTGLDDALSYELTIGAYRSNAAGVQIENGSTAWTVGGTTQTTVVNDADDSYVTFTNLSSTGGVLTISSGNNAGNTIGAVSALTLTAEDGTPPTSDDSIRIDFGETAPATANWNQFSMASNTTTISNLIRSSDGEPTTVGITVSGISGNGLNHLVGSGSSDASIYFDHIFAQNESPDDTLIITIFGLDDSNTYNLFGGFYRDLNRFEHIWTVGGDVRTNTYDGTNVDGYETFTGISPSGGEITFTISDLDTSDDWASISELTISCESFDTAPPVAFDQNVRTPPSTPLDITLNGSGSNLTFAVVSGPIGGTLSGTEPDLTYTPNGGFLGTDSFNFTVSDGESTSAEATVSITVAENGPNFIIFLTDDQGYNDLGVQGSPHILTPRIDTLAAQGIRFTSGYVPSPVCGPCRAGILTGSYPIRIGEHNNQKFHHTEPHGDEIMIPELLKTVGYTSALIGKWHNSGQGTQDSSFNAGRGPIDQGFDYFYGTPSHNGVQAVDTGTNVKTSIVRADISGSAYADADLTQTEADQMIYNYTQEAMTFMENAHNTNQPFFLKLAHNMPHVSLATRQSYRDSAAARGLDVYTAVVEELDWSLGAILDKLDELGIADNTFIIYSSDNGPWTQGPPISGSNLEGYYGSAFPLRGSKMRPLEGGPRVPFIVRWPGTVTPSVVSDEIVTLMDLFPTFMDYAGVEMPAGLEIDGKSIRNLIEGTETVSPHDYYYYYCYTYLFAIRDTRWKLVLPRRNSPYGMSWWAKWIDRVDEVQLFDLDNDAEETTNLAAQYPEIVKRLLDQVEVARLELGDKDRIGTGARFHADPLTQRPDVAAYNNNAPAPFVEDPLSGLPSAVRTSLDTAFVSYDEPGTYTSVELVWAYVDQGQVDASAWAVAEGGGSVNLGAKGSSDAIEYELTGLNPFRGYVFRFIFTDAIGSLWSIPAPISASASEQIAYEIGIDFSDGGSTGGSGSETGWNVINGNGTDATVYDLRNGNTISGVSIQTTGASGGEMTDADLGFGEAGYGNYVDTPFSDLSANDGVWSNGTMQVVISGVDDGYAYDVQVLTMPSVNTALTDLTIDAGGVSQLRTYASFRPYINNDPAPYTNSDAVLTSPFYSRPILVPAVFENVGTDGAGNLIITLTDNEAMALNAIHITAKVMQPRARVEGGTQFQFWVDPLPAGKTFHIRSTADLTSGFTPMIPAQQINDATVQPIDLSIDPNDSQMFFRVQGGAE